MSGREFPAVLPAVPVLPTAPQWNDRALYFGLVGPRRRLFEGIREALVTYEHSRRAYAASSRSYLQRRQELQHSENREWPSDRVQRRDSGSNAGTGVSGEGRAGYGPDLGHLLDEVAGCHERVRRAWEAVFIAYEDLEALDKSGGGGGSKAMSDLQTCLAAWPPSRWGRGDVSGSSGSAASAASELQRRRVSSGACSRIADAAGRAPITGRRAGADRIGRGGRRRKP
jgi:hypothetical protein